MAIAGGVVAVIVVGGFGFVLGRATIPRPEPAPAAIATPTPKSAPTPSAPPIWGRAQLVTLAFHVSDAVASDRPPPEFAQTAIGQRLDLVIPFGCTGAADAGSDAPLRWRYDDKNSALRIHVEPTAWTSSDWSMALTKDSAIRGFWIPRPWSSNDACPVTAHIAASGITPIVLPGQSLAVAQFLPDDRHAKLPSYDIVKHIAADAFDASEGFRVRLRGRIAKVPGSGTSVRCVQPVGSEQRPICVIAISLDEVRVENAATGTVLGTWSVADSAANG